MASMLAVIADEVVAEINKDGFSTRFAATRANRPKFELGELKELTVVVSPGPILTQGIEGSVVSRGVKQRYYTIEVGILQRIDPDDNAAIDVLLALGEEIQDHFHWLELNVSNAICTESTLSPPDDEHLDSLRQFTAVLTLTFRRFTDM